MSRYTKWQETTDLTDSFLALTFEPYVVSSRLACSQLGLHERVPSASLIVSAPSEPDLEPGTAAALDPTSAPPRPDPLARFLAATSVESALEAAQQFAPVSAEYQKDWNWSNLRG
jgi:hypothetical protein